MNEIKQELIEDIQRTFENVGEYVVDSHLLEDGYSTKELTEISNLLEEIYKYF